MTNTRDVASLDDRVELKELKSYGSHVVCASQVYGDKYDFAKHYNDAYEALSKLKGRTIPLREIAEKFDFHKTGLIIDPETMKQVGIPKVATRQMIAVLDFGSKSGISYIRVVYHSRDDKNEIWAGLIADLNPKHLFSAMNLIEMQVRYLG